MEKEKGKKKAKEKGGPAEQKKIRKYVAPPESNKEKIEYDDDQFKLVRHSTKSKLENVCNNIRDNVDLTSLKTIDFNKL